MGSLQTMAAQVSPPTQSIPGRRSAPWLVLAAVSVAGLLLLLWWIDPRDVPLGLCALHRTTGLYCPGCGATRATHELLHGRLAAALHDNALWILSLPLVLYAAASQIRLMVWGRPLPGDLTRRTWLLVVIVALAVAFGVLRNVPCEPFTLLTPR